MTSLAAAQSTLTGLGVGLSLIVAIGAQNAFVLRKGLQRAHVLPVVAVCALSDAVLILAGVAGIGVLVDRFPVALRVVTVLGALFLLVYGLLALNRARTPGAMTSQVEGTGSLIAAVATCLALTWLNPHVYLDTVVFLGSIGNRQPGGPAVVVRRRRDAGQRAVVHRPGIRIAGAQSAVREAVGVASTRPRYRSDDADPGCSAGFRLNHDIDVRST